MSDLTKNQLLELVNITLSWANDVAELWSGTMYEKFIELRKKDIKKSLVENDLEKVEFSVCDLAQLLNEAEEQYQ